MRRKGKIIHQKKVLKNIIPECGWNCNKKREEAKSRKVK